MRTKPLECVVPQSGSLRQPLRGLVERFPFEAVPGLPPNFGRRDQAGALQFDQMP